MDTPINFNELKLKTIFRNAPLSLIEVNSAGTIVELNVYGEGLLKSLVSAFRLPGDNLYVILERIGFASLDTVRNFPQPAGLIIPGEVLLFFLPSQGEPQEKHFNFTVTKFGNECIMFAIDDITQRQLEDRNRHEAELGKAIAQSKFEIASGVLHDIGNAVVGFGSYLTRIRRALDQNTPDNLENLTLFMEQRQAAIAASLGEDKAAAVVTLLKGITRNQKDSQLELHKSITEQLNIITHIQEILAIQRQYVFGNDTRERKPVNLRSIINDCLAMLFASFDKRGIALSFDVSDEQPVLKGDRTKLMQVFLNLIKNSIEALDNTSSEKMITVTIQRQTSGLVVTILDSGIGFDRATGQRLFSREYTTKKTGSGLGLYNCKAIIESHSGSIELTSAGLGQGALATVTFFLQD